MADRDQTCGVGNWRPHWLNKLANVKCFIVIYSIVGIMQGMASVYSTSTYTSMEKRFKISTRDLGFTRTGNEISEILLSLIVTYYGARGRRPLWMAWGLVISACSSYLLALLHLMYGAGEEAFALTEEGFSAKFFNSTASPTQETSLLCLANSTTSEDCELHDDASGEYTLIPVLFIFLSQFLYGMGFAMVTFLATTYMDDHMKRENTPLMLGITMSVAMLGPAIGYYFSSFCLSIYIDPSVTPVIKQNDPRWIGAWWLGWIVLGTLNVILAMIVMFFPKNLPQRPKICGRSQEAKDKLNSNRHDDGEQQHLVEQVPTTILPSSLSTLQDQRISDDDGYFPSLMRVFKNKILMCNTFANVFCLWGGYGLYLYLIKYTEIQYHTSAAGASIISGSAFVWTMAVGYMGSGLLIRKFKPRASLVLGWNVLITFASVASSISYIFLGCEDKGIYGLDVSSSKADFQNQCNKLCNCEKAKYQPVCFTERNITFFSPCHIGCKTSYLDTNGTKLYFTNCSCIPDIWTNNSFSRNVHEHIQTEHESYLEDAKIVISNGPCPVDCSQMLYLFVLIISTVFLLFSSGRIANLIINLRCVAIKDKSLAQGFSFSVICIFVLFPAPIVYGWVIDSTCVFWDATCELKGNCWIYDADQFRLYFNLLSAVAYASAASLDIILFFIARNFNLYEDKMESSEETKRYERKENIFMKNK